MNLNVGDGKSWKMTENDFSENNKARNSLNENYDHFHIIIILKTTS